MILRDLLCLKNGDREGEKMDINNQLAISIRGASHFASGKPVQDYSSNGRAKTRTFRMVFENNVN